MAEENIVKSEVATDNVVPVPQKKLNLIRPEEGMACFYANHIQLGQSAFDVRVMFGEITNADDKSVEVTQRVQVTMAWLEAKVLAEFLTNHIRIFEERNGPMQLEFALPINAPVPNFPRIVEPKSKS